MAEEKIRLPSGIGGLTNYGEGTGSKLRLKPAVVVVIIILIIFGIIMLHIFGKGWVS